MPNQSDQELAMSLRKWVDSVYGEWSEHARINLGNDEPSQIPTSLGTLGHNWRALFWKRVAVGGPFTDLMRAYATALLAGSVEGQMDKEAKEDAIE